MRQGENMQLILLLLLLATGGGDFQKFGPVLETFGNEEVKSALKEAEQLRGIMSAFGGAAAGRTASDGSEGCAKPSETGRHGEAAGGGFPLAPVSGIANAEIIAALVRYFSAAPA